jgi:hypothetical protein
MIKSFDMLCHHHSPLITRPFSSPVYLESSTDNSDLGRIEICLVLPFNVLDHANRGLGKTGNMFSVT